MDDIAAARELLQYRIIAAAFDRAVCNELVVKGGFALRLGMNSLRATKDIDLQQSTQYPVARLQTLMKHAIKTALAGSGLTGIKVSLPKQTDTTARWKINGVTELGSAIHLTIEVSRRDNMPSASHIRRVDLGPDKTGMKLAQVDIFDEDAMAASKTIAILSDNRVVARDLFDLDLLIKMQAVPPIEMIEHLQTPEMIRRLHQKLELITWAMFKDQVLTTIEPSHAQAWTEERFMEAQITVASALESWLTSKKTAAASTMMAGASP
jgi:hypothetical protein